MREILFRGKRMDNGEWVYGCLLQFKGFAIFDHDWKTYVPVHGETVGQCTGLTDKNGKRIFEGDVVSADADSPRMAVCWEPGYAEFRACWLDWFGNRLYRSLCGTDKLEVIGNIHDNPELLKGGGAE